MFSQEDSKVAGSTHGQYDTDAEGLYATPLLLKNGVPEIDDLYTIILVISSRPHGKVFACDTVWKAWFERRSVSAQTMYLYIFSESDLQGTLWHGVPGVVDLSSHWDFRMAKSAYCESTQAELNIVAFKHAIRHFQREHSNPVLFPRMLATVSDTDLPLVSYDHMVNMPEVGYLGGSVPMSWICLDGSTCTVLYDIVSGAGNCIVQFSRMFSLFSTSCADEFWYQFIPRTSDEFSDYVGASRVEGRLRAFKNARQNRNATTIFNYKSPGNLMSPITFTTLHTKVPVTLHFDPMSGVVTQESYVLASLEEALADAVLRFPFDSMVDRRTGNGTLFFRKISPTNIAEEKKIGACFEHIWNLRVHGRLLHGWVNQRPPTFDEETRLREGRVAKMIKGRTDTLNLVDAGLCSLTDVMRSPFNGCAVAWTARLKMHIIDTTIMLLNGTDCYFEPEIMINHDCYDGHTIRCTFIKVFARGVSSSVYTVAELAVENDDSLARLKYAIISQRQRIPDHAALIKCRVRIDI